MTLKGEVSELSATGDAIRVSLTNIKSVNQAEWRVAEHRIVFEVPLSNKAFHIGRRVVITVDAR